MRCNYIFRNIRHLILIMIFKLALHHFKVTQSVGLNLSAQQWWLLLSLVWLCGLCLMGYGYAWPLYQTLRQMRQHQSDYPKLVRRQQALQHQRQKLKQQLNTIKQQPIAEGLNDHWQTEALLQMLRVATRAAQLQTVRLSVSQDTHAAIIVSNVTFTLYGQYSGWMHFLTVLSDSTLVWKLRNIKIIPDVNRPGELNFAAELSFYRFVEARNAYQVPQHFAPSHDTWRSPFAHANASLREADAESGIQLLGIVLDTTQPFAVVRTMTMHVRIWHLGQWLCHQLKVAHIMVHGLQLFDADKQCFLLWKLGTVWRCAV